MFYLKKAICIILSLIFILTVSSSCAPSRSPETQVTTTENPPPEDIDTDDTGDTPSSFKVPYVPVKSEKEEIVSEEGFYMSGSGAYVSPETVARYPRLTNLPTLYINIDSPDGLGSVSHGVYSQATYTFASDYIIDSYYEKNLQIKGRGNWSWSFDQKPYTLKLSEKADLCGMGEAKKWILVTVHSDKTMMHNYITQKLAKNMGLYGSCDNEYVDVVCN